MSTAPALFSLERETIVVTGGYGLIGRALVSGLHGLGARIGVIEPRVSEAQSEAAFGALAKNDRIGVFAADVTKRDQLEAALTEIKAQLGGPTGLVNNAALDSPPDAPISENGPFESYPEESWDRVMNVNVKGVFLCCQVFGAAMAQSGRGAIVNVSSIYGAVSPDQALYEFRREDGQEFYKPVAYSASKSALYNLTRYVAVYWGPKNVRANTVTFAGVFNNQDPRFLEAYARKIPLRRDKPQLRNMAEPNDYIGAIGFLLSPASSYMTGADIRVDGGFMAV
ncbi:SDR family oxidoreductase [Candidatus Viadribacter manganicus]|uniref:Short-chain dehydrogenase n=1 Tax=Candidatus Viadribacter manganicus TaxID=1759059 RepID=A0A1B1AJU8_9PROT|nr:SDR family oxidoreductase [Candidatus Viadribacter manganicus]ANP46832.1 short-chain dehydrogenase [Candidatus Viadribacter manganicus]